MNTKVEYSRASKDSLDPFSESLEQFVQGPGSYLMDLAGVLVLEDGNPPHGVIRPSLIAVGIEPDCTTWGPESFLKSCPEGLYFSICDFTRRLQRRWPDLSAK